MSTFVNTLHVLVAVLLIGPLLVAPFIARWAITRRSTDGVRLAANLVILFGAGSLLVAALGVATTLVHDEWTLSTPWVLISATLYVVALGLIAFYAVPALRKAVHILAGAEPEHTDEPPAAPTSGTTVTDTQADSELRTAHRLHTISARVTGAGWLLLVTFAAITALMTIRPFE